MSGHIGNADTCVTSEPSCARTMNEFYLYQKAEYIKALTRNFGSLAPVL